jgi:hypothetical protein
MQLCGAIRMVHSAEYRCAVWVSVYITWECVHTYMCMCINTHSHTHAHIHTHKPLTHVMRIREAS